MWAERRTRRNFFYIEWLTDFLYRKLKLGNLKGLNASDACLCIGNPGTASHFFPKTDLWVHKVLNGRIPVITIMHDIWDWEGYHLKISLKSKEAKAGK